MTRWIALVVAVSLLGCGPGLRHLSSAGPDGEHNVALACMDICLGDDLPSEGKLDRCARSCPGVRVDDGACSQAEDDDPEIQCREQPLRPSTAWKAPVYALSVIGGLAATVAIGLTADPFALYDNDDEISWHNQ